MAAVKPISELTIAPNGCFAFIGQSSETASINYDHPDGVEQYANFEAFAHGAGTLLRFPSEPEFGRVPWNMRVVLDDESSHLLQWGAFEDNYASWGGEPLPPHSFLAFMKSKDIRELNNAQVLDRNRRCDQNTYGPGIGYFPQDGIKPTSMDLSIMKNRNASLFRPIVSATTVSHITTFNFHGIYMSWRNWPIVTLAARTLSGSLRQAAEWRDLYLAGLSSISLAKDSHDFFEYLGISQEMIDELKDTEVMMPTERFMRGYGNPRHGFNENGIMPESLKNHLMKQLTFKDLSVLEAKHPLHPLINSEIKSDERKKHQMNLYEYIVKLMPHIDSPDDVTTEDVYAHALKTEKDDGSGPLHPVDGSLSRNAVLAARFFDATN